MVMKYVQIPLVGTVMLGNSPYDAEFFFKEDDWLHIKDSDTDAVIRNKISVALRNATWLRQTALNTYLKVKGTFALDRYHEKVLDEIYYDRPYNPIPRYLKRPYDHSVLKHQDLPPQEFARSNSWGGLEELLIELSNLTDTD